MSLDYDIHVSWELKAVFLCKKYESDGPEEAMLKILILEWEVNGEPASKFVDGVRFDSVQHFSDEQIHAMQEAFTEAWFESSACQVVPHDERLHNLLWDMGTLKCCKVMISYRTYSLIHNSVVLLTCGSV
uniref:Uncharacterized protein n=1 Tax=Coccidioides posadasii RMSCC 3488 TaxID=454284 RepID=A0A0J6FBX3_COCPO|nr:hypothetical protein CPAG_02788 [Coccidioides posadasii RMSCC 3488]